MHLPKRLAFCDISSMRLVDKLQRLIAETGMTQTAFEAKVGLPANRISKWVGGQGEPTARQALRMARMLKVPVDYLVDDEMDSIPDTPISDREKRIWEVVMTIGPDEAWRRLVNASGALPALPEAEASQRPHASGGKMVDPRSRAKRGAG